MTLVNTISIIEHISINGGKYENFYCSLLDGIHYYDRLSVTSTYPIMC